MSPVTAVLEGGAIPSLPGMPDLTVAVVGDHLMKPEMFVAALRGVDGGPFDFRTLALDWPDTPMRPGTG